MQHLISDVIVPTEDEIEIKNGQRRTIQRKIYPGYVLIRMQLTDDTWYLVRNTPGVSTFVGNGNKPSPLDEQEVRTILRTMEADEPKVRVTYTVGQTVKIIDSPTSKVSWTLSTRIVAVFAYWFHFLVVKPESISTSCR